MIVPINPNDTSDTSVETEQAKIDQAIEELHMTKRYDNMIWLYRPGANYPGNAYFVWD